MYISIDMGGTYTRIGSSKDFKSVEELVKFNTKKELVDQKNIINYYIKKFSQGYKVKAICLGVPGTMNYALKKFLKFPNYKALNGVSFDSLLSEEFKSIPLIVLNDSHMAGYMEAKKGSGENYKNVLYISIGTGIGGVWIKNKNIEDIYENFEPGHYCIFSDGLDFEDHCSGRSFKRIYNVNTNDASDTIWKTYAKELVKGLSFLKSKYPCDVIVLGGGFSVSNFDKFKEYLPAELNIKLAEHGDNSGILGGFEVLAAKY